MSLYESSIPQYAKMLRNIDAWLDKAAAHAAAKSYDTSVLLNARLAPDQYPLVRQIQLACDEAKGSAARLAGQEPPKHPDTEQTFDEIRARLKTVIAYLETIRREDFEGAESRRISLSYLPGLVILGADYLHGLALPNFYFHATTAYSILRKNGVELGKRDFIGSLPLQKA